MPVKTLRVRWEGASNISHTFELFPEFLKALGWSLHRNRYRPQTTKATCGGGRREDALKELSLTLELFSFYCALA